MALQIYPGTTMNGNVKGNRLTMDGTHFNNNELD